MKITYTLAGAATLAMLGACTNSNSSGLDSDAGGQGTSTGMTPMGDGSDGGAHVTPPSADASPPGASGTGNGGEGGTPVTGGGDDGGGGVTDAGGDDGNGGVTDAGGDGGNGSVTDAGGNGGNGGVTDAGGSGGPGKGSAFTCNEVIGVSATDNWYEGGQFETLTGITNANWQLKFRLHAFVSLWADPNNILWQETGGAGANGPAPIVSPCTAGSHDPDRVAFVAYDPTVNTQAGWEANLEMVVTNLVAKYTSLKEVDLFSMARAPGNMPCANNHDPYTVTSKYIDDAIAATAAKHPGLVKVGPPYYVSTCTGFTPNDTNLTASGSTDVAKFFASLFGS
jgi:hypothetical protein